MKSCFSAIFLILLLPFVVHAEFRDVGKVKSLGAFRPNVSCAYRLKFTDIYSVRTVDLDVVQVYKPSTMLNPNTTPQYSFAAELRHSEFESFRYVQPADSLSRVPYPVMSASLNVLLGAGTGKLFLIYRTDSNTTGLGVELNAEQFILQRQC